MSERVPATADPIGIDQETLNAFLDCPGSLEASLLAAVRAQNETGSVYALMEKGSDSAAVICRLQERIAALQTENDRLIGQLEGARAFVSRHPSLTDVDRAEFCAFVAMSAALEREAKP